MLLLFCLFQEWQGFLSSISMLLSSSTLVAIVLIIQSELEIETTAMYTSAAKIQNGARKASLKKTSIKTSTTTTTTPSSESSQTGTDTSDHNHSPSNSVTKQQKATMKFSNLSSTNRGVKSAICLSWLLPILCAMCIPMIHKIIGHRTSELEITSPDFIIFAITESLLVFLFVLLFVTLMNHLIYLSRKYEKVNTMLRKRYVENWNLKLHWRQQICCENAFQISNRMLMDSLFYSFFSGLDFSIESHCYM